MHHCSGGRRGLAGAPRTRPSSEALVVANCKSQTDAVAKCEGKGSGDTTGDTTGGATGGDTGATTGA